MFCNDCAKATAGKCTKHSQQSSDFADYVKPFTFTTNLLYYTYYPLPVCIACGKESEFTVRLPYGSRYDGDCLCGDCIHAFVDPVINWIKSKDLELGQRSAKEAVPHTY